MTTKILIVDDDIWISKVLNKILKNAGYNSIMNAYNGFDAIAKVVCFQPDIILLDLIMPGIDGLATLKLIKSIPDVAHSKIVICSSDSKIDNIARAMQIGANDFISKPFTPDVIVEKLDCLLQNRVLTA